MHAVTTRLYETQLGSLNKFRCPLWHPAFLNPIPPPSDMIVFPREAVTITQSGRIPVVANVNLVMLYNQGQCYRRQKISDRGDRCEFFRFDRDAVIDSVSRFDPSVADCPDQPFRFSHGYISGELFIKQRRLLKQVEQGVYDQHPIKWDEDIIEILDETVAQIFKNRGTKQVGAGPAALRQRKQLVFDTQAYLSQKYFEKLSLQEMATELDASPFHLCRIFKSDTGLTIHDYITRIRLRVAIENIQNGTRDLTRLALDLGFSSHSHFTAAFRKAFRLTPSQWRKQILG